MRGWRQAMSAVTIAVVMIGTGTPDAGASQVGGANPGPEALLKTPVLSIRRVPDWVADTVARARVQVALNAVWDGPSLGGMAERSCLVATQGSETLFAANASLPVLPASNMKLLTSTAVLQRLGAADRLVTTVAAGSAPQGGVLHGDLYLIGGGDDFLRTPSYVTALNPPQPLDTSIVRLADQVRAAGITEVTGSVIGDGSRYDDQLSIPTWDPVYITEHDVGQLSALEVNEGFALPTHPVGSDPDAAAVSAVAGSPAADPAARAAAIFTQLLAAAGVDVRGLPDAGGTPPGAVRVTSVASPPLGQEVDSMLEVSDDTAAELLTKELGFRVAGNGSTVAGTQVIRETLAADHLPLSSLVAADGSGLDRLDRASCDLIHDDLAYVGPDSVIAAGLPVAGRSGTLVGRLKGTPAVGRLRAKTGTLRDVVALSGFVNPPPKPATPELSAPIVFSLILNAVPTLAEGEALSDRVGVALAEYPQLPPMTALEPLR